MGGIAQIQLWYLTRSKHICIIYYFWLKPRNYTTWAPSQSELLLSLNTWCTINLHFKFMGKQCRIYALPLDQNHYKSKHFGTYEIGLLAQIVNNVDCMQHLSVKTLTLVGQRPSLYVDRKTLFRKLPKFTSREELHGTSRNEGFETVVFWTHLTSRELHGNFTELHGMRVLKKTSFSWQLCGTQ